MEITDAKVIAERLSKVRDIMKTECVDIYVVVTGDYHISEYAGDYFKEREFITGFTGSAGTAVITQNDARPVSYTHLDVYKRQVHQHMNAYQDQFLSD